LTKNIINEHVIDFVVVLTNIELYMGSHWGDKTVNVT